MQFSEYQPPKFGVRGDAQAITTGTAAKQEIGAPHIRGLHWRRGQRDRVPAAVDEAPGQRTCCGRKGTQNRIVIDSGSEGLCKRLVKEAWGVRPSVPAMDKHLARGRRRGGRRTTEREELERALGIRVTRRRRRIQPRGEALASKKIRRVSTPRDVDHLHAELGQSIEPPSLLVGHVALRLLLEPLQVQAGIVRVELEWAVQP